MELLLNKIIELDNKAKGKITEIKEKEENIENYISEKIEKEKKIIDSNFQTMRKSLQEEYDNMYEAKKIALDVEKNNQIKVLRDKYESEKSRLIEKVLNEIV